MKKTNLVTSSLLLGTVISVVAQPASAVIIDNDIASGTVGHLLVDVDTGGESRRADITANRQASGDVFTEDLLFDYFSYVDVGNGGLRLSGSAAVSNGDDSAVSNGSFTGANGNNILWSVTSRIDDGGDTFFNIFDFQAETGELGDFRFYQYLDEDIQGVSDDVLVTRGTAAAGDLELFTLDNVEEYGVSHSGALNDAQGLVNSSFAGWAADEFSQLRSALIAGTAAVSITGIIDEISLTPFNHPTFGSSWGPEDITSVLAWDVVGSSTSATIITTLGGLADIADLPPIDDVPAPATIALMVLGLAGIRFSRRRKA